MTVLIDLVPMTVPNEYAPMTELTRSIEKNSVKDISKSIVRLEKRTRYGCLLKPIVKFEFL